MPATNTAAKTCTRLADLTSAAMIKPSYIENGRLKWEARSAGALIKMFAAGGYDVVTPDNETATARDRIVKDQDGTIVAYILWNITIPDFAYAYTSAV